MWAQRCQAAAALGAVCAALQGRLRAGRPNPNPNPHPNPNPNPNPNPETNPNPNQVQAAYQCSLVLRSLIRPHLLRRLKADVALNPNPNPNPNPNR